jgi:UDP-N-acetyl-alpha-D-muramoyl-L-alanyl-L-glutamate epimerase
VAFNPDSVHRFRLTGYDADVNDGGAEVRGRALLRYALDEQHRFEEVFEFACGNRDLGSATATAGTAAGFERVVRLLHLAAGVSYYKTAAPRHIVVETGAISEAERQLMHGLYDRGLREFAVRNRLEVPRDLHITAEPAGSCASQHPRAQAPADAPAPGVAVPIGGGKDSIVVAEALRERRPILVSVNPNPASRRVAAIAQLELLEIHRTIDPGLFELNTSGALNGHVPVTAIVSLATVAGGYACGYDTTVVAMERSADAPTRRLAGRHGEIATVNHQWSKSTEAEHLVQGVLRSSVHPSVRYLSPLRRFDELEITEAFATLTPYLPAFRSCNKVSRISGASDAWCLDCPKCRFVFLALATALDRRELTEVFGADLLADGRQVEGFVDLLQPERKPFECVGTVEEVDAAFRRVLCDSQWAGAAVLERIRPLLDSRPAAVSSSPATPTEVFETVRATVADAKVS